MKIVSAEFVSSYNKLEDCPNDKPEIGFIGRSNVGKSTLVNFLAERKQLAKTSSKPGKTQTINYFMVNYLWYLVDLPGYGYAITSKTKRAEFDRLIKNYIYRSPNLINIFVLVDASIQPQKKDLDFINSLGQNQIPLSIIFTKADKVSKLELSKNVSAFNKKMLEVWEELPKQFITSVNTNQGRDEILAYIDEILKEFKA